MTAALQDQIERLVISVREHPSADLYRFAWGNTIAFDELPTISRAQVRATPLTRRTYANEIGMVKAVRDPHGSFLSQWSFFDIAREPYGETALRPMVYLSDPHEALEKSMWCYEHNMVPVIAERVPDIAVFAACAYEIDSLITDSASLGSLRTYLATRSPLDSITVIDSAFDRAALQAFAPCAKKIRLVLALPETGAIAAGTLAEPLTPLPNCLVETRDTIVVTKAAKLAMPIIKYSTDIDPRILTN